MSAKGKSAGVPGKPPKKDFPSTAPPMANAAAEDIYVFKSSSGEERPKKHKQKGGKPFVPKDFVQKKRPTEHSHDGPAPKKAKVDPQVNMSRKEKKADRKAKEKNYDIVHQAKQLWEQVRQRNLEPEKKKELLEQLYSIIKGKVLALIFKHDCSRVIQTCLKYCNAERRGQIALELKGNYVSLAKNTYSRFLVTKVLKYSPKHKSDIVKEFLGHTVQLIRHKDASFVVEDIFVEHATGAQRKGMVAEFFGPEYSLFKQTNPKTLAEIIAEFPEKRPFVMKNIAESVLGSLNKGTVRFNLIHQVISEYMDNANEEEMASMIDSLKENIPEIIHTKKGHRVAITALLKGNPKDRKLIVKGMKDYAVAICKDSYGNLVIIQLFEVVDDTVLVQKSILAPMIKELATLVNDKFGRRPILYLLAGRSPKYFIPQTIKYLQENDEIRALTSKKDPKVRRDELMKVLLPELVTLVTKQGRKLIKQSFSSEVLCEILLHGEDYSAELMDLVASYVNDDASVGVELEEEAAPAPMEVDNSDDEEHEEAQEGADGDLVKKAKKDSLVPTKFLPKPADKQNIMTHIIANRTLKRLIVTDYKNPVQGAPKFGPILLKHLKGKLPHWAGTWGAVVVVSLLESPLTQKEVFEELKPHIATIKKSEITASQLLASKLEAVSRGEDITSKVSHEEKLAAPADEEGNKESKKSPAVKRTADKIDEPKTPVSAKKTKTEQTPAASNQQASSQTPKQQPGPTPKKTETPKAQTPKAETPKAETPKAETPKAVTPKAQTPKLQTPKALTPKAPTPKAEMPKAEPLNGQVEATQDVEIPEAEEPKLKTPAKTPGKKQAPKSAKKGIEPSAAVGEAMEQMDAAIEETSNMIKETRKQLEEKKRKLQEVKQKIKEMKATQEAESQDAQPEEAPEEPKTPNGKVDAKPPKTPKTASRKPQEVTDFLTPSPLQTRNQRKAKEAPKTEPRPTKKPADIESVPEPKSAKKPVSLRHTPPMTRSKQRSG